MVLFNGTEVNSFKEAIALGDGEVKLVEDISLVGENTSINSNIVLDLNGFNIQVECRDEDRISIQKDGKLTLKDSVGSGKIFVTKTYTEGYKTGAIANYGGEFVMESGHIYTALEDAGNNGQFCISVMDDDAKVTINGGYIEAGWYGISGNGSKTRNSTIIINGGSIVSTSDFAIYHPQTGKLIVNGGVISGAGGAVAMNNGEFISNGGTYTSFGSNSADYIQHTNDGTYGLADAAININSKYGVSETEIKGGTIVGKQPILVNTAKFDSVVTIEGGKFIGEDLSVVKEYLAEGITLSETGDVLVPSPVHEDKNIYKDLGAINTSLSGLTIQYIDSELVKKVENGDKTALYELEKISRFSEDEVIKKYAKDKLKFLLQK